ncbi:MAG TPA: protein sphX, partial [Pseudobdellovibrionaceae bacterium]|nr:protein sphX [Pseudobdellovibrionaceae bacterium]
EKALARAEVKAFVKFYLENSAALVPEVKYVALPKGAYDTALQHLQKGKMGTVFNGDAQVGLRIEDLLKKEASL